MPSLSNFDRALFYDSSPATDQLFEERSSQLFENDDERSCIQLHTQPDLPEGGQKLLNGDPPSRAKIRTETSDSDCDSPSTSPLPVDQSRYLWNDPPQYVGAPGLIFQEVSDANALQKIAMVITLPEKPHPCR